MDGNFQGAYTEIPSSTVETYTTFIVSHVFYKVKIDKGGQQMMRARLVFHGNRDHDHLSVQRDSASHDLSIFRLLISSRLFWASTCLRQTSANMHADQFHQENLLRPATSFKCQTRRTLEVVAFTLWNSGGGAPMAIYNQTMGC